MSDEAGHPDGTATSLVAGVYELFHEGEPSGTERWHIGRAGHGLIAEGEQIWAPPFPYPNTQRYRVELSPDWRVSGLEIDWMVRDRHLRASHRAQGETWIGRIDHEGQARDQRGNYPYSAEVGYGSHLFNTFTLLRRGFGPGTDEEFPVLFIGPPLMAVTPDRQRYRFVERGEVQIPAGRFEAWRWLLTHPTRPGQSDYTFWTDHEGVVLESYEAPEPGRIWMRLVEYRRFDVC